MVSHVFCKIDGIKGESTDSNHKDEIEVLSYSHGVSQPASAVVSSSGGGTTARCNHTDLTIVKYMDIATPELNQFCCTGKHLKKVTLTLRRSDGDKSVVYMTYILSDVIISSVSVGGGGDDTPTETVTFNYAKVEWEYTKQKRADGAGGGNATGSWDLAKNTK